MRRPRFTIGSILAFVLFLAVGLAGLKGASEDWDGGILGLTLVVLLASVLLAIHGRRSRRAYWLGFALFGWSYVALCQLPAVEARLPTTRGLIYVDSLMPERSPAANVPGLTKNATRTIKYFANVSSNMSISTMPNGTIRLFNAGTGQTVTPPKEQTQSFVAIGHSLVALMLAFLGALASRFLHDREAALPSGASDQETPTSSPTSSSDAAGSDASILIP